MVFPSSSIPKMETQGAPKVRWGELEDEDDYDFLPPPLSIGPDENGLKKIIEYKFSDDGAKLKVTTTTRVRKLAKARLSKKAMERRARSKFGDAANAVPGAIHIAVSTEEIILERPRPLGAKADETKGELSALTKSAGAVLMVCRTCGKKGDHWTSKLSAHTRILLHKVMSLLTSPWVNLARQHLGLVKVHMCPPGKRPGADRSVPERRRNDENSVRVTNLSEDTR